MRSIALLLVIFVTAFAASIYEDDTPYPFTRELTYNPNDIITGDDVFILQNLINRWEMNPNIPASGSYDMLTADAVQAYKEAMNITSEKYLFDFKTAHSVINAYTDDHFRYDGKTAKEYSEELGLDLKYLIYIPVHRNRSIESIGEVRTATGAVAYRFHARTHGHTVPGEEVWPSWDNSVGLSQFASSGNTPTGLMLVDLNTPEPPAYKDMYGPYNINRVVQGLRGNAAFIAPRVRNGLLLHTGNWASKGWQPGSPMPNSSGCVHAWPEDVRAIADILAQWGVDAHENSYGQLPYPHAPQGLLVVELVE